MTDQPPFGFDDLSPVTRRALLRGGAAGAAGLALTAASARAQERPGHAAKRHKAKKPKAPTVPANVSATYDFNQGWRFGGVYKQGAEQPGYRDGGFARVTLPHTVVPLSWGDWNPPDWEQLWIYRKPFTLKAPLGSRVLLDFQGVMTNATVYLNGSNLATHLGGFLPFTVELTDHLLQGHNDLAVVVDGRLLDVPPLGNVNGSAAIDYLVPAGIYRDATLEVVPDAYISDVFAKPVSVLSAPGLEVEVAIDALDPSSADYTLTTELLDGARLVKSQTMSTSLPPGATTLTMALNGLAGIELWSPSSPKLYTVRATLTGKALPPHTVEVTTGFRQATFEIDGFYLNGERMQIFGLNHHQLFPYTGMAAPARLQARDAQLLKDELGVNMVRCSHYPQSPHFLDACDALGLMVWEEPPGWQYIGDANFDAIFLQNVHDMVTRDRNRPSVVVWGTRLDETSSYPTLYGQARQLAYALDGTRQTTGAMDSQSTTNWAEDVFAYDDYAGSSSGAQIKPPVPGVPYLISEAVGAITGAPLYRWIDPSTTLQLQAQLHSQVHEEARTNPQYSGVIAWCSVDYASQVGGGRVWQVLRWPGVLDTFRVPKPGAAFYRSQINPAVTPVILPAFYWDFGPSSPPNGPGPNSLLATNCDQLVVYVDGVQTATVSPSTAAYANPSGPPLYPPVYVNLTVLAGSTSPTLMVEGYVGGSHVTTLMMSSDTSTDRLVLNLEDTSIAADGSDMTRLTFRALDVYGNQRPYVAGDVTLSVSGPVTFVGQNPFAFAEYGGVGGVFLRSEPGQVGTATITASHPTLGTASATLTTVAPTATFL